MKTILKTDLFRLKWPQNYPWQLGPRPGVENECILMKIGRREVKISHRTKLFPLPSARNISVHLSYLCQNVPCLQMKYKVGKKDTERKWSIGALPKAKMNGWVDSILVRSCSLSVFSIRTCRSDVSDHRQSDLFKTDTQDKIMSLFHLLKMSG